ncbi:hypothetical protein L1887_23828 [Cichorium endivia]|nr:hypothetical protein L1887_23828 [Cichorium endivia]
MFHDGLKTSKIASSFSPDFRLRLPPSPASSASGFLRLRLPPRPSSSASSSSFFTIAHRLLVAASSFRCWFLFADFLLLCYGSMALLSCRSESFLMFEVCGNALSL